MGTDQTAFTTMDEYIGQFQPRVQSLLQSMRNTIREAAPDASEKISWQMPTFFLHGNLVHFAAHKGHIGFYPGESGIAVFKEELSNYKSSKGAVQFPYDRPLPLELIDRIVRYRAAENTRLRKQKMGGK